MNIISYIFILILVWLNRKGFYGKTERSFLLEHNTKIMIFIFIISNLFFGGIKSTLILLVYLFLVFWLIDFLFWKILSEKDENFSSFKMKKKNFNKIFRDIHAMKKNNEDFARMRNRMENFEEFFFKSLAKKRPDILSILTMLGKDVSYLKEICLEFLQVIPDLDVVEDVILTEQNVYNFILMEEEGMERKEIVKSVIYELTGVKLLEDFRF